MTPEPPQAPGAWHERPWLRSFFTAVQFLTRVPVPGGATRDPALFRADISRGLVFFPLIGALIGCATALALWAAAQAFSWPVAVLLALGFEALLTGAFHEDAVADFCDAFGGGWTRDDVLRIMKDSRVGSFGTLGLGLAVALRAVGLTAITDLAQAMAVVIVAGAVGRLVILFVMALLPPIADREGLSKDVGAAADWSTVAGGGLLVAPLLGAALALAPYAAVGVACVLSAFVAWYRRYLLRRIGGVTGDCLGFSAYVGLLVTTLAAGR